MARYADLNILILLLLLISQVKKAKEGFIAAQWEGNSDLFPANWWSEDVEEDEQEELPDQQLQQQDQEQEQEDLLREK